MTERAKERELYKKRKRELQTEVPKPKSKKSRGNFCIESKIMFKPGFETKENYVYQQIHDWKIYKRGYRTRESAEQAMKGFIRAYESYRFMDDYVVEFRIKEK